MRFLVAPAAFLIAASLNAAHQTQRFTVESPAFAEQRAGMLEKTYSEFLFTCNVQPRSVPAPITVTIHPDEKAYRKATGARSGRILADGATLTTFEQPELNSLLVRETVRLLYGAATRGKADRESDWLLLGLTDAVETRQSGIDSSELRSRLRLSLKKEGVVSLEQMRGTAPIGSDSASQRRYRASATSLTAYLLNLEGGLGVRSLLEEIASGRSVDAAVERAYPGRFRDLAELYRIWMDKEVGTVRGTPGTR